MCKFLNIKIFRLYGFKIHPVAYGGQEGNSGGNTANNVAAAQNNTTPAGQQSGGQFNNYGL